MVPLPILVSRLSLSAHTGLSALWVVDGEHLSECVAKRGTLWSESGASLILIDFMVLIVWKSPFKPRYCRYTARSNGHQKSMTDCGSFQELTWHAVLIDALWKKTGTGPCGCAHLLGEHHGRWGMVWGTLLIPQEWIVGTEKNCKMNNLLASCKTRITQWKTILKGACRR